MTLLEVRDGSICGETQSAKVCFYTASQKNNVLSFNVRFTLLQTQQVLWAYFLRNYLQPKHLVEQVRFTTRLVHVQCRCRSTLQGRAFQNFVLFGDTHKTNDDN
jgi:hypothetical protein